MMFCGPKLARFSCCSFPLPLLVIVCVPLVIVALMGTGMLFPFFVRSNFLFTHFLFLCSFLTVWLFFVFPDMFTICINKSFAVADFCYFRQILAFAAWD
jgi:hypothetical protein